MDKFIRYFSRNRIKTSFTFGALVFLIARPEAASFMAGIPFILLGALMRTWASGHIRKNSMLATGGPYRYTRNALYVGNFLAGLGFSIVSGRFFLVPAFIIGFLILYDRTIKNEEEYLATRFGDEYRDYVARTNRFFPWIPKFPDTGEPFSWPLVTKHREYNTWLGILAILVLFYLEMIIKAGMAGTG